MSKSLVTKATSDTRDPCQGYHLRELAEATKRSIDEAQTIEDALVKQLKRNKPNVKRKALKVVKYISEHGSPNFKRGFQRHSQILRECAQYRGPPDPVYGDSPYEEVRKAAKEALDALFRTLNAESENELRSRIKGMGSGPMESMGSTSSNGSYAVTGYGGGSSSSKSSSNDTSITKTMWNYTFGKKEEPKDRFENNRNTYGGPRSQSSQGYTVSSTLDSSTGDRNGNRKRGAPGGVWGTPQTTSTTLSTSNNFSSSSSTTYGPTTTKTETTSSVGGKINSTATTGEYEQQIVDAATRSTGITVKMAPKELNKFVQQYQGLDQDTVAELLAEKMESETWQVQLKALYLTEAVLKSGYGSDLIEFMKGNQDLIEDLLKANKRQVRQKAKDVGKLLGMKMGKAPTKTKPVTSVPAPPIQQQDTSLLDFGATQAAPQQAKETDMFGGLNMSKSDPAASQTADMFGGLNLGTGQESTDIFGTTSTTVTSQPAQPAQAPADNLFAGLTTGGQSDSLLTSNPAPAPATASTDDFLTSLTQPAQPTSQNTTSSSFDFLNNMSSAPVQNNSSMFNTTQQPSTGFSMGSTNPTGTGFGFASQPQQQQQQGFGFMQPSAQQQKPMQGFMQPQQQMGFGSMQQQQQPMGFGSMQQQQQPMGFGSMQQQPMGFGSMQQQPMGFGVQSQPQGGFGMQMPAQPRAGGIDHFSTLMQQKRTPVKTQQQRGGKDAFADLVKF